MSLSKFVRLSPSSAPGVIGESWTSHRFPLGFLFGLGFDTATEVWMFGVSVEQAAKGVSFWAVLVFPLLFAAGMSLIDTTDGVMMLGAYTLNENTNNLGFVIIGVFLVGWLVSYLLYRIRGLDTLEVGVRGSE